MDLAIKILQCILLVGLTAMWVYLTIDIIKSNKVSRKIEKEIQRLNKEHLEYIQLQKQTLLKELNDNKPKRKVGRPKKEGGKQNERIK